MMPCRVSSVEANIPARGQSCLPRQTRRLSSCASKRRLLSRRCRDGIRRLRQQAPTPNTSKPCASPAKILPTSVLLKKPIERGRLMMRPFCRPRGCMTSRWRSLMRLSPRLRTPNREMCRKPHPSKPRQTRRLQARRHRNCSPWPPHTSSKGRTTTATSLNRRHACAAPWRWMRNSGGSSCRSKG